ncbi:hypothetical protein Scep_015051 [Stephania cephalantha]|uniref:Signal peptidase complex subunit 2 n=1 Tax=Stephania cephalantha TaxID=152367 RepID=A0AAP0P2E9_9MAGN
MAKNNNDDTTATATDSSTKNPKKANLLDPHSIKHILDESVTEVHRDRSRIQGRRDDEQREVVDGERDHHRRARRAVLSEEVSGEQRVLDRMHCVISFVIGDYIHQGEERDPVYLSSRGDNLRKILNDLKAWVLLMLWMPDSISGRPPVRVVYKRRKPRTTGSVTAQGSFNSTGLMVSSKLPRFSDMYTLSISSADPKSVSAKEDVHLTKSVTQWFTSDGILAEGLFWKDVEGLINKYAGESKKKK